MRVCRESDIPAVKDQIVAAGFRFKDDEDVITTGQMARVLGISETHLRHLERKGVVRSPQRDSAGRRMWRKADVDGRDALPKKRGREAAVQMGQSDDGLGGADERLE